jgi:hypothetical protein
VAEIGDPEKIAHDVAVTLMSGYACHRDPARLLEDIAQELYLAWLSGHTGHLHSTMRKPPQTHSE